MLPVPFLKANTIFNPPPDMDESQVLPVPAFLGEIKGGNVDGQNIVVVAWQPSREDLDALFIGSPVYLSMMGGLAPHCMGTTFESVTDFK